MSLTKEDLKEAASKWNWKPSFEKSKVTTSAAAKRESIARHKREALQDELRIAKEFSL